MSVGIKKGSRGLPFWEAEASLFACAARWRRAHGLLARIDLDQRLLHRRRGRLAGAAQTDRLLGLRGRFLGGAQLFRIGRGQLQAGLGQHFTQISLGKRRLRRNRS